MKLKHFNNYIRPNTLKNFNYLFILLSSLIICLFITQGFSAAEKPIINQQNGINVFSEASAYKMLYENQLKSNDAILKTIYYALGGLGTAVLLVFGSNWWFNDKKVRDVIKDIDAKIIDVKKEVLTELIENNNKLSIEKTAAINQAQSKLQEEVTAHISSITLKFTDFTEKIRAEIKEDNKTLSENYQKQLESFNEIYRQQFTLLSESIISQNSNIKEIIDFKEKLIMELISTERNQRTNDINSIQATVSRNAYYMWDHTGVFRNAFSALLDELALRIKNKTSVSLFSLPLKQMIKTLEKCTYINSLDKEDAISILAKLPEDEETNKLKEEILMQLEKITIN